MDNFLDRYQIPKLIQDQIDYLNDPITPKGREVVIESLPNNNNKKNKNKKPNQTNKNQITQDQRDGFKCRILSELQRSPNTNTLQTIPQNRNSRNITQLVL